jgi:hypothetical protein
MGCVEAITADDFPRQDPNVGGRVTVCFHYDFTRKFSGVLVPNDHEAPFCGIIALDDGRYVLVDEGQWTPDGASERPSGGTP